MNARWFGLLMGEANQVAQPLITNKADLCGIKAYDLKIGKFCRNWNPNAKLSSNSRLYDGMPDDMLADSLGIPVFSEPLRNSLANARLALTDIQYLPVHVENSRGAKFHGFAIANIITRIPALDRKHSFMCDIDSSEIDPLTGKPKVVGIGKEALRGGALRGHDMIRLLEFFPSVCVSERFVEVFHGGRFTGATFTPLRVT